MSDNFIRIRGARAHNLKNVNLDIPKNKLVVLTGVSGSGKSSLAFDTLYAEGQRRYVESLSSYARQFLGIMQKPDVDSITGLSPAISIDQKTTSHNPRSTVGTVTEIYDYLRLLFARVGHPHCPLCGREISHQSLDEINLNAQKEIEKIIAEKVRGYFFILSPVVISKKGEFQGLFDNLKAKGFSYVRIDGFMHNLKEEIVLLKTNKHTIDVLIDKISVSKKDLKDKVFRNNLKTRLSDDFSQALDLSQGNVILSQILDSSFNLPQYPKKMNDHLFSEKFACPLDNIQIAEIAPRTFSFNSPHGACETCSGLGRILKVDKNKVFSKTLSIKEGAILPFSKMFENDTWWARLISTVAQKNGISLSDPLESFSEAQLSIILYGTGERTYKVDGTNRFGKETYIYESFSGISSELEKRFNETESEWVREEIKKYMSEKTCGSCQGKRLKKEALGVTVGGNSISEVCELPIDRSLEWVEALLGEKSPLSTREKEIGNLIIKEVVARLKFLISVGLNYLSLDRASATLSGGEAQRIRLASQIGSGLTGVLYVLDEPTIGLHPKDNIKLINTLVSLKDLGNSVVVVEHDKDMIENAQFIADFGPHAGKLGGFVVASGSPADIKRNKRSLTGKYLKSAKKTVFTFYNIKNNCEFLSIKSCQENNLKNIDVNFPVGKLTSVTGVSGSGKSTLLVESLYSKLREFLNQKVANNSLLVPGSIEKVYLIDQSPIGKTPRSNPATYTKVFDQIRDLFAISRESKLKGFKKGRFSFNVKGGRCENCEGQGQIKIEMQFMSDIWITCDVCSGSRYNSMTLEVKMKGKSISDVLNLTVDEAIEFFHTNPKIVQKLSALSEVGLSYIELGQPATTLSGGEAQRVKLASELSKTNSGKSVYILDEPTTGLHFADVAKLLNTLKLLTLKGNTVLIIEHNLDIIRESDWIVDLGPEGGEEGGYLIFEGEPSELKKHKSSHTAKFL